MRRQLSKHNFGKFEHSVKIQYGQDLNLRRLNPFKTDINIVRHNFKNQSQQTDLRKHFPVETYTNDVKYDEPIAKGE
jgi:hypothetical protein